jgi:IS1 family transposase
LGENNLKVVCRDGNPSYSEVLDEDNDVKHVVTKSETGLVESYNSVLRHYLAKDFIEKQNAIAKAWKCSQCP